jgi:hypothetical protein
MHKIQEMEILMLMMINSSNSNNKCNLIAGHVLKEDMKMVLSIAQSPNWNNMTKTVCNLMLMWLLMDNNLLVDHCNSDTMTLRSNRLSLLSDLLKVALSLM